MVDRLSYWVARMPIEDSGDSELDEFVNGQIRRARAAVKWSIREPDPKQHAATG